MTKVTPITELQEEITRLEKYINDKQESITKYKVKQRENKGNMQFYQRFINKNFKEIEKANKKIEQLKYQITVDGRKLKSAITVSKDLTASGFEKAVFYPSGQIRGWGDWKGEYRVTDYPAYITVDYMRSSNSEGYQKLYNYLQEKYGTDLQVDISNNFKIAK